MRLLETTKLIAFLRERANHLRKDSQNIHQWVDEYLDRCKLHGQAVTVLTQWCLSKGLERRFRQENGFHPTKKERIMWSRDIPLVLSEFHEHGFTLNWYITFNRGFTDSRRLPADLELLYKEMIIQLAEGCLAEGSVIVLDWEEDVLQSRPQPDLEVLQNPTQHIDPKAFLQEVAWVEQWMRSETDLRQNQQQIEADVLFQIACEAAEGRFLFSDQSPFGSEFILVPLEVPEQYDFFCVFVPGFKKRIAAALPPYPWRLKSIR